MTPLSNFQVAKAQISGDSRSIAKIEGNYFGDADAFIQIFDSIGEPADGDRPLKSWPITAAGDATHPTPFFQTFDMADLHHGQGGLELTKGLYFCVSSTASTKTALNKLADVFVEVARKTSYR